MLGYARVEDFWFLLDKYKDIPQLTDLARLWGDLKEYQRLFVLDRILQEPRGTRLCEVGGGLCNVFEVLLRKYPGRYECWSVDPLEGQGGGPKLVSLPWDHEGNVRLIREQIGRFSKVLPCGYFDILFSISVLEHIPFEEWEKCFIDMVRICRQGAIIIHSVDVPVDSDYATRRLDLLKSLPERVGLKFLMPQISITVSDVRADTQTYYVSPGAYARWLKHFPKGQNTLTTGMFQRVTALNAVYLKV